MSEGNESEGGKGRKGARKERARTYFYDERGREGEGVGLLEMGSVQATEGGDALTSMW